MTLRQRLSELRRKAGAGGETTPEKASDERSQREIRKAVAKRAQERRKPAQERRKPAPTAPSDNAIAKVAGEVLALGREMVLIPAQAFMAVAEAAGAGVLWTWRRVAIPLLAMALALARAAYRAALRHVTPPRAVAAVAAVAVIALAASQWLDYRGVSVGTDAYSGDVELVAPAPDVERDRAGDAHAWVMLPLAALALAGLVLAVAGRARAALLMVPAGIAAVVVSAAVDAPKGLDEGVAAVAYQGVEARLLEGFWLQVASGAVLVVCGLLLPLYLRAKPAPAPQRRRPDGPGPLRRLAAGAGAKLAERSRPERRVEEAKA